MNMDMTKILLALCAVLLMVNTTLVAIDLTKETDDGTPAWAKTAAAELDENGGTVYMRNDDGSVQPTPINPNNRTFATPQGIVSTTEGGYTYVCPYDHIAYIRTY